MFQDSLIDLSCTTGDMRNYSALACHKDGNKSHFLETLTLFQRIRQVNISTKEDPKNILSKQSNFDQTSCGYLLLPFEGICLKLICGKTIINCALKNTIHIPDTSRNFDNWSKVHGPCGLKNIDL